MKISEYIKELEKIKNEYGDLAIINKSDDYELRGNYVKLNYISKNVSNMKKETKTFFDDFDGCSYNKDVYVNCNENEGNKYLILY